MNKSKIEWCDRTWNPITGCLHKCRYEYCYAAKQAKRFALSPELGEQHKGCYKCFGANSGTVGGVKGEAKIYALDKPIREPVFAKNEQISRLKIVSYPFGFEPTFRKYKLFRPQKIKQPQKVFVGSMSDMFGEWVPDKWIVEIFEACAKAPWHKYLFLTKNPSRYIKLAEQGKLLCTKNVWYGTSIEGNFHLETYRLFELQKLIYNTFVSIEPLKNTYIEFSRIPKWVIVGAESSNRKDKTVPKKEWLDFIIEMCDFYKTPLFMKNSLKSIWSGCLTQEYPEELEC
ncbi:MAG: phage Gp37/Gp68 family protein [Fibromonadales bacterium]|nr:phage Gp37/Gp68 family protein [Fibromonadales bacterium]